MPTRKHPSSSSANRNQASLVPLVRRIFAGEMYRLEMNDALLRQEVRSYFESRFQRPGLSDGDFIDELTGRVLKIVQEWKDDKFTIAFTELVIEAMFKVRSQIEQEYGAPKDEIRKYLPARSEMNRRRKRLRDEYDKSRDWRRAGRAPGSESFSGFRSKSDFLAALDQVMTNLSSRSTRPRQSNVLHKLTNHELYQGEKLSLHQCQDHAATRKLRHWLARCGTSWKQVLKRYPSSR